MMERNMKLLSQRGFSLLEVVIAIGIFAIGMLALASLQGSLTRSSNDANLRMVADNIAERTLEDLRAFKRIDVDPAGLQQAYDDIQDIASETVTDGGVSFTRTINVSDYFFVLGQDKFLSTEELDAAGIELGVAVSDFKLVEVNVSWGGTALDNAGFQLDESQNTLSSDDLGSGDITISSMISSITTQGSARVSSQSDENPFVAVVDYDRDNGNRELIALKLGEGKLKESLTPEPDVTRSEDLIETRFDVITYSSNGLFLRREEFAVVSCECTFEAADGFGRRPVVWAGDEYVRGHKVQKVQKPRGKSANNQQSPLCVACCADHHDGGSDDEDHLTDAAVNVYNPFRSITGGDHAHYNRSSTGGLEQVTSGDYVEACRLVRQDGFFRVAQDFRREDLNVFPDDFLDSTKLIDLYSSHTTGAVSAYATAAGNGPNKNYPDPGSVPSFSPAPKQGLWDNPIEGFPDAPTQLPSWTTFPDAVSPFCTDLDLTTTCQQLTSRGVYLDYLSEDLRSVLANCTGDKTPDDAECKSGDVELDRTGSVNPLELIPFFDVQMTKLNRWNEAPANNPVETLNKPLQTGNTHDRGVVYKVNDGESTIVANGHRGNVGFTDSYPIDTEYYSQVTNSSLVVHAGSATAAPAGTAILGSLSHLLKGQVTITVEGLNGVECGQTTADYGCSVPTTAGSYQIKLSGYGKATGRVACSVGRPLDNPEPTSSDTGADAYAIFDVSSQAEGSTYNFLIVEESEGCPVDEGPI